MAKVNEKQLEEEKKEFSTEVEGLADLADVSGMKIERKKLPTTEEDVRESLLAKGRKIK